MTDRELMQQSLEKLEFFAYMKSVSEDTTRLITRLRERLAQPEQEPVAWMHPEWRTYTRAPTPCLSPKEGWIPLYAAPPKRKTLAELLAATPVDAVNMSEECVHKTDKGEQEPVGFFSVNDYGNWEQNENGHGTPFYTAPPQREWVGLTDQEIESLAKWADKHASPWHLEFAYAIEAKLKEKSI